MSNVSALLQLAPSGHVVRGHADRPGLARARRLPLCIGHRLDGIDEVAIGLFELRRQRLRLCAHCSSPFVLLIAGR
jgi:hypothetical protein